MEKIGEILSKSIKRLKLGGQVSQYRVFEIWDSTVGKQISDVAQPYDIQGKTLFVTVRDNVWMRHLKFLDEMLKSKINSVLGEQEVTKIVLKIGDLRQREMNQRRYMQKSNKNRPVK